MPIQKKITTNELNTNDVSTNLETLLELANTTKDIDSFNKILNILSYRLKQVDIHNLNAINTFLPLSHSINKILSKCKLPLNGESKTILNTIKNNILIASRTAPSLEDLYKLNRVILKINNILFPQEQSIVSKPKTPKPMKIILSSILCCGSRNTNESPSNSFTKSKPQINLSVR